MADRNVNMTTRVGISGEKEYKEAVEERIYRDIKQPYEWTVEGRFEQKEEIFLICELDEGYNGD